MTGKNLGLALIVIAFASQAFAWGPIGHELIATVGAKTSNSQGWNANSETLKHLSTVPDRLWKSPATKPREGFQHWFEIDGYPGVNQNPSAIFNVSEKYDEVVKQFGLQSVQKNGTAPWRANQFYKLLVSSLKGHDFKSAVEYAGLMAHYVGDVSQPFHVTENYDGQLTGNQGIHGWFETQILENQPQLEGDVTNKAAALRANAQFQKENSGSVVDVVFHEAVRSLASVQEILDNDKRLGRNSPKAVQTQLEVAKRCLADGSATYALLLARAEMEAGVKLPPTAMTVSDPSFIEPNLE